MNKFFTAMIFAISFTSMYGQYFCETEVDSNHIPVIHGSLPESNDTVVLKVYLHSINNNHGEKGYTNEEIEVAKCILARDFRPYNIFFDFQPIINYNSNYFFYSSMTSTSIHQLVDSILISDGINIFFWN